MQKNRDILIQMTNPTLKEKTARGLLWGGLSNGIQQMLNLLFGIFLARMLTPTDYGMVGMLAVFTVIATTLQEGGFTAALVNKREVQHQDYNAVFWFSVLLSCIIYSILSIGAPLIASYYRKPELIPLARYTFLGFIFSGMGTAHSAWLFKKLMVKQRATAQIIALIVSGCISLVMAWNGYSYWGIATQNIIYTGVTTFFYWYFSSWKPTLHINLSPLKNMFGFSSRLLVTNMFSHMNYNMFSIILGRYYPTQDVGFYEQAYKWSSMGGLFILGMTNSVAQPVLAEVSHNREQQQYIFRKLMLFTICVSFTLMWGMGFFAENLVTIFLTEKWAETIPLLRLLCISGAFVPITNLYQQLLISCGRSDLYMWGVITEGILILACLIMTSAYGVKSMLMAYVCLYISFIAVWHWLANKKNN